MPRTNSWLSRREPLGLHLCCYLPCVSYSFKIYRILRSFDTHLVSRRRSTHESAAGTKLPLIHLGAKMVFAALAKAQRLAEEDLSGCKCQLYRDRNRQTNFWIFLAVCQLPKFGLLLQEICTWHSCFRGRLAFGSAPSSSFSWLGGCFTLPSN